MQSSHPDFGQAGYPQQYGYPQTLQSVQSNAGHDMNKQVQQGQPQMYANSGGMASAPQHHHQGGMAGPAPSPQQTTLVQQGQQMSRAHMQIPGYYAPRNNVPRTVQSMGRNPMSSVVNQQPQQASSHYNHAMQIVSAVHHPLGPLMQVNPQIAAQMYQQRYSNPPQYSLIGPQYHQPLYQPNFLTNTYNNGPQPNANGFYSQHQMPSYNTMPSQMPPIQPAAPAPQLQQPPKKRLAIIDPSSGKNILENVDEAGPSKENEPADSAICIEFATQVARLANNEKSEPKSSIEGARISQPVVLCPSELESEIVDTLDLNIGEICEPYVDPNQSIPGSHETLHYYKKVNDLPIVNDTYESKIIPETVPDMEILDSKVHEPMPEETVCELKEETITDNLVPVEEIPVDKPSVAFYNVPDTVEPSAPPLVTEVLGPRAAVQDTVMCQSNLFVEETNIVPLNSDVTELPASNLKSQEKQAAETKKNKAKKKKDLNKRGESKEGGDMDAFLDMRNEEVSSKTSVSPLSIADPVPDLAPESPPPALETPVVSPVVEERSPTPPIPTIVDSEILSTIPLPGETIEPMPNDVSLSEHLSSEVISVSPNSESEDKENVAEDSSQSKIVLKYTYKEGEGLKYSSNQWSPLNPEGKKQYDRDFLLQLQSQPMSMCKPANLPNLDVIRDKAQIQRLTELNRSAPMLPVNVRAHDPFIPNFARGGTPRPPHPAMGGRRSQQGRGGEKKQPKVINLPSSQGIKLHEAGNAWKASVAKPHSDDETAETNELYKKVRGILNKLTPQKFETLVEQVKNFDINTEEKLNGVIDLVFEKAIDEPNFSVPYANMCKQLALIKVPIAGQPGQYVNFRKLLLTKCQKEFEQDSRDELQREEKLKAMETASPDERKILKMEFDQEEKKMRYRQLGNIRFIGELFKLGMLIEPIMHECIKKLLTQADEESLECLCKLLKTIGKELEEKGGNKLPGTNIMNDYFSDMQDIVDKRRTSSRVRFMLQDVIDLKRNNWVPRRDENLPKTIDQIHKEAEKEAFEQQQKVYTSNISSYPKRMPDDRRKVPGRMSEDGWTPTSKNVKGTYSLVDPTKLKLTKPEEIEGIRLGPGGGAMQRWGRGSSGGNKTPAEAEIKTALTNRYSALADQSVTPSFENRRDQQRSAASSRESSRGRNSQMLPPTVRKTPSTSRERESLIEAVKEMSRTQSADAKHLEVKMNNDSQLNGKAVPDTSSVTLKGPIDISEDDMDKKTKPLIDELIHNADYEEAIKCVTELTSPLTVNYFIYSAINQVLERSSQARYLLGQLFYLLVKRELITLDQYKKGLSGVLENVDDYAVDIPLIWEYMGEIIEPMVGENKLLLTFLKEILEPCIPSLTAGKLVSAVLHCAAKKKGTIKLGELWKESNLQWTTFLDSSTDVAEFIHNQNLDFTVSPTKVPQNNELSTEEIREQLKNLLESTNPDENEKVLDWIDARVPASATTEPSFIRALTSAIHEICIKADKMNGGKLDLDSNLLKKRIPLLTHYINRNENLELQALYAIQKLVSYLGQPKGVLRSIFDCIYDEEVITEETFKQWEQSKDPNEEEGKSVALLSAKGFFTWLKEAEVSGEDNEGE